MVSIVSVDARKTSLTGVQNSSPPQKKKKKKKKSPRRYAARGQCSASSWVDPLKLLLDLKRRNFHALLFMVSIVSVDARKTSLTGVQNSSPPPPPPQTKIASPLRGSWTMLRIVIGSTPLKLLLDFKRRYHELLFMVSIVLVDARKISLTGVQNSPPKKKNRLAATRLGLRGSWTMLRIVMGRTPLKLLLDLKKTLSCTAFYGLHCVSRCQENITYRGSK